MKEDGSKKTIKEIIRSRGWEAKELETDKEGWVLNISSLCKKGVILFNIAKEDGDIKLALTRIRRITDKEVVKLLNIFLSFMRDTEVN